MNDRPQFSLLALALCSVVSYAQEPASSEFTATIKGGNTIKGEVLGINANTGTTRLRFEHAKQPIDLNTQSILTLKRDNTSEPIDKSRGLTDLLLMRNGDRFPAKVNEISNAHGTNIETTYSGSYTLPAESLQRISFGLANLPIFSGPREEQEWVFLPAEDPTIKIKDGYFKIKSSGSAAIDAGLTECSIIDLTIPPIQRRYISLALGSNALEASDKDDPNSPTHIQAYGATGSYFTGNAYVVRASSRTLTLQGAMMTPEGKIKYSDLGIRFTMPRTGLSRKISIGFNRRDKVIAFWVDGEYLGKYHENGDWIGTGSAIVIGAPSAQTELTLGGITVREWHGMISDEFAAKGMQSKDILTLSSGERFTGTLVSRNNSKVVFETSLSLMTFPPTDVATIDFGIDQDTPDDEADEQPEEPIEKEDTEEAPPLVKFGGSYGLQGDQFDLAGDQLQFIHPILGNVTLPFKAIDSIKFH